MRGSPLYKTKIQHMKEKTFEAKLCRVSEVKFPLVEAAFKGKDGNVYGGMMLIDTGGR